MMFYRAGLCLCLIFLTAVFSFAASEDIENRLFYSNYSKRISMDFKEASLTDVLKIFSKQSGLNFISAADVSTKKVTVFLDQIPVEEALEKILDANDLTYEITADSNVFIVKPKNMKQTITRVFPLKYASVSKSKINGKDTAEGIKVMIDAIKSASGKIEEDARTNSLIVTDLPEQFPLIEETISKLDVSILQILIQVEILDVSKGDTEKIGLSYYDSNKLPLMSVSGSSRQSLFPWDLNNIRRKALTITDDEEALSDTTAHKFEQLTYAPGNTDFSNVKIALDFLKSKSDTRVLARPRVMTLNNQTAHIEVGGDQTVGVSTTTTTGTSGPPVKTEEPITKQVGLILDVTPQANVNTGEIILKITPEITDTIQRGEFTVNSNPVFDTQKRKADTLMKAQNGQTIVLGGLLRTEVSNSVDKLPFLGDLPLVGATFRHKNETKIERELIIVITPYIVDENFKKKLEIETAQRLDREGTDALKSEAINQQLDSTEKNSR